MKKISTILLAVIGMQLSINAEIIYFEKMLQRDVTQVLSYQEFAEQYSKIRADYEKRRILLGTIRLEEGEELTIKNRKWTRANCCGNEPDGFNNVEAGDSGGHFYIEIDFDKFTQNENIETGYSSGDRIWWESRSGSGLRYDGSMWPVEGPATIKIHIKPGWYAARKDAPVSKDRLFRFLTLEQYCRISFNKTLASYQADQNQLQALVLPKGVPGMSVIMESSDDLVNWTRDTLGRKPTANRPKFFRLRAVKE